MRWKWAALVAVLICGVYLLVSCVYDLIILNQSFQRPVVHSSQFAKAYFVDDKDTYIIRPQLLNYQQNVRNKRSLNEYNDTKTVVNNNNNNSNKTISINFNETFISSLLTQDYYLYRMNLFGDDVVINLTRLTNGRHAIFAPNFILQHLDTNYTWITPNSSNVFIDNCMYTGRIVGNSTTIYENFSNGASDEYSPSWRGSILLNLCRGMYGVLELPQGTYFLEPLLDFSNNHSALIPDDQPHLLYRHQSHTFHDYSTSRSIYPILYQRNVSENTFNDHSRGYFQFAHPGHHRRKKSTSWDHYVEILVVADAQMRRYHRTNLENYVLTLLSIVATIYRHPSLEAALNIVVVRLIVLDHENAGPKISENAQETLKHFCRWQQTLNDDDDNSINHHDVAILLTRHDICRAPGKCDTLGLAELGTMCDSYRSCAIIEDNGLSAAFTIAHELGHIFNIPHDDENKCSQFSLDKYNFHIMAPTLEYNTHPWSWSPCSASLLHRFLDSEKARCLFDKPVQQSYSQQMVTNPTPGVNFSVHQQCQYVFGPSSQLCPFMPPCKRLWCTNVYSYQMQAGCRTQHMPWADGTSCAYNKWCYRGECVPISPDQLTPVDGGWGGWKDWGECSRTCGGGVERAIRDCDNPRPIYGGKYCIGERVRYRSCNLKECPSDTPDFREVQCSEFNGNRHSVANVASDVKWVPRYNINSNDRCKLYCTVQGGSDFYLLKTKVVDGTPCGQDTDNICVDGICRQAGCDFQLGSNLKRDECGICGGDGKTCRKETGNFNGETTYGYNSVIKIPAGVNNIDIRQKSWNNRNEDDNYLALLNSKGEFILNGHFQVTVFRQQIRVRGAVLEYSGSDTAVERINTSKPLLEDLFLHVLAVGQLMPPNINWEYMIHDTTLALSSHVSFEWRMSDRWTPCDKRCHGSQIQQLVCIQVSDNQPTEEKNCENSRKPDIHQRVCNLHCQLKWSVEVITPCSVVCGTGEVTRRTLCVEVLANGLEGRVEDEHCRDLDRPLHTVACYRDCAGRHWVYTNWDTCSQTCGSGVQRREAHCYDQTKQMLEDRYCESISIEPTEQQCNTASCPTWHYGEWSKCSQSCDGGIQMRIVTCRDSNDREVNGRLCNSGQQLEERRKCNEHLCTKWKFESWSECSQTCGDAVATRKATCVDSKGNVLDENMCISEQKITAKPCKLSPCPQWRLGEWSSCSQTCLDGWSSRRVECVDSNGEPLDLKLCGPIDKVPPAHKPCNYGPCPFWRIQEWSSCSVSCGVGQQDRIVECVYKDEIVDVSYCRDVAEPATRQSCATISCPEWEVGPWEPCTATCGEGYQHRTIKCTYPDTRHIADSKFCDQKLQPKAIMACIMSTCTPPTTVTTQTSIPSTPATVFRTPSVVPVTLSTTTPSSARIFYAEPSTLSARYTLSKQSTVFIDHPQSSPTRWEMGAWSECSVTCGEGEQVRYVACRDIFYRILPDLYCSHLEKPHGAEQCIRNTCGEWNVGDWQPCPSTCGDGHISTRPVTCVAPSTENVLEWSFCDPDTRPVTERSCNLPLCSEYHSNNNDIDTSVTESNWRVGEWGQCSQTCGSGWQQRLVICVPGLGMGPIVYCVPSEKPIALRPCAHNSCPRWMYGDWGQCNRTCGGGYQQRIVECVNPDDGEILPWQNCSQTMPPRIQKCNLHKCRHHGVWKIGKWSPCSSICGRGVRTRTVECVDEEFGFVYRNEAFCLEQKPVERHRCRMARCPRWKRGKWSMCSVSCGEGVRNRQVYCTQGRKNIVSNKKCGNLTKPPDTNHCRLPACPSYNWVTSYWTRCSHQCGNGRQVREVYCVNNSYQKSPPSACNSLKRPTAVQACVGQKCPYEWFPGPWTTCSRSCDEGEQFRNIHCQIKSSFVESNYSVTVRGGKVADQYCSLLPKPATKWRCTLGACESNTFWQADPWSECSVTCGWGIQLRKSYCSNRNNTRISRTNCNNITSEMRPRRRRRCFTRNCDPTNCAEVKEILNATVDSLYDIIVGGRNTKIYCLGMSTSTPLEYLPLPSGPQTNYAEIYGKRLMFPFTCPNNGSRNDSCYCTDKGNTNPGLTRFTQIRIDLYHMKINLMDGQFAVTEYGDFVPYATAGDCYSAVNCPQARFSVDLRGTGFKIAEKTTWKEEGHRVAARINRLESGALIHGLCGGYCGKCYPDKNIGLEIELDAEHF